jgi:hypothetical protein
MAEINAGLGSLSELKAFILASSMSASTDVEFDAPLTALGLGVAGMFASRCNRDWAYGAANREDWTANRSFMAARHFPLNMEVPVVVERCDSLVGGVQNWVVVPEAAYNIAAAAGLVYLAGYQGNYLSRIRLTSAGGYWWLGLDAEIIIPVGASPVPPDLKLAWLLQCQALWLVRDNLGTAVAGASGGGSLLGLSLPGYDLIPEVKTLLSGYIRYAMNG